MYIILPKAFILVGKHKFANALELKGASYEKNKFYYWQLSVFFAHEPLCIRRRWLRESFKKVQETVGGSSGISQTEIVNGLKEALEIGTGNTVRALSETDGYYNNPELKIPLPESMQKFEKILRATGYDSQLNEFELSMNRAAEKAAPEAEALLLMP